MRDVVTADGTRISAHLIDDRWNRDCSLSDDGCWPATLRGGASVYTDAECSNPLFFAEACETPVLIEDFSGDHHLFSPGPRWTGPIFQGGKGCSPAGEASGANAPFLKGPPLDADAVATARLEPIGTGGLRPFGLRGAQGEAVPLPGTLLPYPRIHDAVAGEDCQPVRTRAGEIRCLPFSVQAAAVFDFDTFADDACTQLAFICNQAPTCTGHDVVRTRLDARGELVDAELRTASDLPVGGLYARAGSDCMTFIPGRLPLATWGGEVSWDKYPLLRERNGVRRATP
jgi:hypothetical protein